MNLHELLTRPLILFDCETTGPNPAQDRIVEFGFIQLKPDGSMKEWETLVNPGCPIPHEATFGNGDTYPGHGITDQKVQGCRQCDRLPIEHGDDHAFLPWPTFAQIAESLLRGFRDCDYGGYNLKTFDLPLLAREFSLAGHTWSYADAKVLDGLRLWQVAQRRTLSDAVELFCQRKHTGAHRVLDDVRASLDVITAQLTLFTRLPRTLEQLHDLQWPVPANAIDPDGAIVWKNGQAVMNVGRKWKGTPLTRMSRRDLKWIAEEATGFSAAVKAICAACAEGKFPEVPK